MHSLTAISALEPKRRDWGRDESGKCFAIREEIGGREGIRTPDPLLAKQMLSQLSYTPVELCDSKRFSWE